jgi:hypothetical protein
MIKKCFVSIGTAGKFYQHDGEGGIELFLKKQRRINSGGGGGQEANRHSGTQEWIKGWPCLFLEQLYTKSEGYVKQNWGIAVCECFKVALVRRNNEATSDNFGAQIGQILLAGKYYRGPSGRIDGWGIKWLP